MADTHCHKHNEPIIEPTRCSGCKSDIKMYKESPSPELEDVVNKFVDRKSNLANRQQYLKNKVSTLERSLPALMAFNMWISGQKCEDAPICKIREIMNKFSPYPDPTEKLLDNLKTTVEDLNRETAELHEKIITADVDLEESGMELESLELSNKELGNQLETLEKEVDQKSTLSLHSIHSEDLVCLTRIRQLGEEERSLKCCIRQLEEKEMFYRKQMECLLMSKEFQDTLGGNQMTKRVKELETSDRKWRCTYQTQKYNMHQLKKKMIENEQELSGTNQNPSWSADKNQERETGGVDKLVMVNRKDCISWNKNLNNPFSGGNPNCPPRYCCAPLVSKHPSSEKKSCSCSHVSRLYPKQNLEPGKTKFCGENPLCQPPSCDKTSASCPPIKSPSGRIPTSGGRFSPNQACKKGPHSKKVGCRCSCKGKCARGKSELPCNCGAESKSNYQPKAKNKNVQNFERVSSDDEFCECDCGCNNEDHLGTCLFN
ncbi:uncharacterized protein LOC117176208 isoform X2 [Belonocnema kinseyi]|uniref:uncharacterized protein LOC117176208 isoform X2 n=1 Tax=Belonocnema kinseyi TaxID=2817044 RepID=UPI00143CF526|nr:uncharacterized protein LOC117176208 isoform X2 [Belonocnema kinseyi]